MARRIRGMGPGKTEDASAALLLFSLCLMHPARKRSRRRSLRFVFCAVVVVASGRDALLLCGAPATAAIRCCRGHPVSTTLSWLPGEKVISLWLTATHATKCIFSVYPFFA